MRKQAAEILDEAVLEVQLRASRTPDCQGGCRERLAERRGRAPEALDERRVDAIDSAPGAGGEDETRSR